MRNKILFTVTLFLIGIVLTAQNENTASASDSGNKNFTKLINVSRDIYMLQGKGGNIGLSFGKDGVFMIDDQYEDGLDDVLKVIKRKSKEPIKFLVNTHHHEDHIGGNAPLAKDGTIIFSHENVRNRLSGLRSKNKSDSKNLDVNALPIITISEDLTFYFNNEKIMVFHVHNAHTDGDVMVYFTKNNVLHTGDAFLNGKYPFIDLKSGGTFEGYISALNKILMVADSNTKIIPGHGDIANINDVTYTINMLGVLGKRINMNRSNGKTIEDILQMKDLTKKYDDKGFGDGFISTEKILRTIYDEIERVKGPIDKRTPEQRAMARLKEMQKEKEAKDKNGKN